MNAKKDKANEKRLARVTRVVPPPTKYAIKNAEQRGLVGEEKKA